MRTISIINQKGGVGKSTTTSNLGVCLAEAGYKVLLIDFDPQGNLTDFMGVDAKDIATIHDVIIGEIEAKDALVRTCGVQIIPADICLSADEAALMQKTIGGSSAMRKIIKSLEERQFDYCLIDCPPNLGILTVNALCASDYAIVPCEPAESAIKGIKLLADCIDEIREENARLQVLGILLTKIDKRTKLEDETRRSLNEAEKRIGAEAFGQKIHSSVEVVRQQNCGAPIVVESPYANPSVEYHNLSCAVVNLINKLER